MCLHMQLGCEVGDIDRKKALARLQFGVMAPMIARHVLAAASSKANSAAAEAALGSVVVLLVHARNVSCAPVESALY